MSRAYINKSEQWSFCEKFRDRCMYAETGKDCRRTECEFYSRKPATTTSGPDKIVSRKPSQGGNAGSSARPVQTATKKSKVLRKLTPQQKYQEMLRRQEMKARFKEGE